MLFLLCEGMRRKHRSSFQQASNVSEVSPCLYTPGSLTPQRSSLMLWTACLCVMFFFFFSAVFSGRQVESSHDPIRTLFALYLHSSCLACKFAHTLQKPFLSDSLCFVTIFFSINTLFNLYEEMVFELPTFLETPAKTPRNSWHLQFFRKLKKYLFLMWMWVLLLHWPNESSIGQAPLLIQKFDLIRLLHRFIHL